MTFVTHPNGHGPTLMAGARSEKGIRRVAKMGCHFLPIGDKVDVDIYRAACQEFGRPPGQVRVLRSCFVTDAYEKEWPSVAPHVLIPGRSLRPMDVRGER